MNKTREIITFHYIETNNQEYCRLVHIDNKHKKIFILSINTKKIYKFREANNKQHP